MPVKRIVLPLFALFAGLILASCSDSEGNRPGLFGGGAEPYVAPPPDATAGTPPPVRAVPYEAPRGFLGLFPPKESDAPAVNGYLWAATLDILHFLPVTSADPYSGVIVTGFGRAPGASQSYRATVLIKSEAFEATTLNLSVFTANGPASAEIHLQLEEAIMTRARELAGADRDQG